MENSKIKLIFQNFFIFIFIFASISQIMTFKISQNFFLIFMKISIDPNFSNKNNLTF